MLKISLRYVGIERSDLDLKIAEHKVLTAANCSDAKIV